MKKHHTTIVLAIIFFTGLIVLWWAGNTGVDPDVSDAILPALARVQVADIKRLEIVKPKADEAKSKSASGTGSGRLAFERRDEGRWQLVEPIDVAADPSMVEALVRNLKDLRKSSDAGTIHDPPGRFGLAPPSSIVRVYGADPKVPLAAIDVGRAIRDQLYVRPEGGAGIEVIDPRRLSMLSVSPVDWRDKALFHLPSFRVGTFAVNGPGRDLRAVRDQGHWLLNRPFRALADDDKVEGLVAELTSLRVAKGDKGDDGFIANDVKGDEAAKYGLDRPSLTIELKPGLGPGKPQTLLVGKPADDQPDLNYARAGDQDDVVLIDARNIRDLGRDPNALRGQKVADLDPARVEFIRVEAFGRTFDLSRTETGWQQLRPDREPAEPASIQRLLKGIAEAQTSEFLDPSRVTQSGIDPPKQTFTVWQAGPGAKPAVGLDTPPKAEPRVVLQVGNYDPLRKVVYARLAGDPSLLTLPETFSPALPRSALEFRSRTVLTLSATQIHRLAIHREGTTYELAAPVESGQSTHWRMLAPVSARADDESVTRVVMLLSHLNAEAFITDQIGDGKAYGLHAPGLTVTWTTPAEMTADQVKAKTKGQGTATSTGTLRVGSKLPKGDQWYANIEGSPVVFTLPAATLEAFEAEFHNRRVMAFPSEMARRLVIRWPGQTVAFKAQEDPSGKGARWVPEPGSDASGFDLSRLGPLVTSLASLTTPRFLQYRGPIPVVTGLDEPRLVIEVHLAGDREPRLLRLGRSTAEQTLATNASGSTGPVFLVTGPAWFDLVEHAPRGAELPSDVFAPTPGNAPQGEAAPPRR